MLEELDQKTFLIILHTHYNLKVKTTGLDFPYCKLMNPGKFEFILMEKSCRMCRSPRILISTFVNGSMVISVKLEGLNHSTIMIQIPVTAT